MKIDTNLSSSPFLNKNLLLSGLILSLALAGGMTLHNAWSSWSSWRVMKTTVSRRDKADWDSVKGKQLMTALSAGISELEKKPELAHVPFVNQQIERRSLSWTRLLDWLESTMPPAVIVTSIRPAIQERNPGKIDLGLSFTAKELDAAIAFIKRLKNAPAFSSVTPMNEATSQDGQKIDFQLRAIYDASVGPPPPPKKKGEGDGEEAEPTVEDGAEDEAAGP